MLNYGNGGNDFKGIGLERQTLGGSDNQRTSDTKGMLKHPLRGIQTDGMRILARIPPQPTAGAAADVEHTRSLMKAADFGALLPGNFLNSVDHGVEPVWGSRMEHSGEAVGICGSVCLRESSPVFFPQIQWVILFFLVAYLCAPGIEER